MALRVGINGLGRIGRQFVRSWLTRRPDEFEIVAVNELTPPDQLVRLLRHDSAYGPFPFPIELTDSALTIGGRELRLTSEAEPPAIGSRAAGAELVVEATGRFRRAEQAGAHIRDSVRHALITTNSADADLTLIYGVNDDRYDPEAHRVLAAGSCTTNCVVPMLDVLHREFGVRHGLMTTVHAYTGSQNLVDAKHHDPRRARAAALNIIPTSTGATDAVELVLPELTGRITGLALRVPTPTVSIADLVTDLERSPTAHAINAAFEEAAEQRFKDVLAYETQELVSSDFTEHPASSVFDAGLTATSGSLAKTFAWYDNEWGYACRLVDICALVAEREAA